MSVVTESGKSKIKPLAILASGMSSLPSLQTATFLLYLYMPDGEEISSLMSLLIKALLLSWGPSLMTLSNPHYFPKAPSPRTRWSGLQDTNLGGMQPVRPTQWFIHMLIKLSMFSIMWSKVLWVYLMIQNLPRNNFNPEENSTCWSWTHHGLTWENSWGLAEGITILLAHWAMYVSFGAIFSSVLRPNPPPGSQYVSLAGEIAKRNVVWPFAFW